MDKKVLDYVVAKSNELINAPTCSSETKESAQNWLSAVGSASEKEATEKYIRELEGDIMPIDMLIDFASSKKGEEYFGADAAADVAAHAKDIKNAGGKFCDCPACAVVAEILEKKAEILA